MPILIQMLARGASAIGNQMKSGSSKHLLWYTRRGEVVRGPFPPGQIRRYLILGRIIATDEISTDQINWQQARDHDDLYPDE